MYTQKRDIMRQILSSNPAPLYSTHLTRPYVLPDDEGWVMREKSKTKRKQVKLAIGNYGHVNQPFLPTSGST